MITGAELSARLTAMGITPPADVDSLAASAVAEWETQTGYKPFLADVGETTQEFDPPFEAPHYILDLGGAFYTVASVAVNGTTFTLNTDYNLLPLNAADNGRGWDKIKFLRHPGTKARSVVVTGRRGLYETAPADAKEAVLKLAVNLAIPASRLAMVFGGDVKQGGVSVSGGGTTLYKQNQQDFAKAAVRYMRF